MDKVRPAREDIKSPPCTTSKNSLAIRHCMCRYIYMYVLSLTFHHWTAVFPTSICLVMKSENNPILKTTFIILNV